MGVLSYNHAKVRQQVYMLQNTHTHTQALGARAHTELHYCYFQRILIDFARTMLAKKAKVFIDIDRQYSG